MLTKHQQKFLVNLLMRKGTRANNGIYDSNAFYRIVAYLKRNGLIQSMKLENNMDEYRLTIRGSVLARMLASLDDVDPVIREKFGLG